MRQTACMLNPAGWDLDLSRTQTAAERAAQATAAVNACWACPLVDGCQAQAEESPPAHACVWGGLVYDGIGPGQPLGEWLDKEEARTRTTLGTVTTCPICDAQVVVDVPGRRYCGKECARRADNERRTARRRVHARVNEPAEVRTDQVRALDGKGLTSTDIATRLNVSRRSVHRYRALLRAEAPQVRHDQLAVL